MEKQIYSGFVQPEDKAIIAEFLESFWEDKFHIAKHFKDPRMKEIAHLMIYHHKPEALPNDIKQQIAVRLAKRVTAPSCKEWRTGDDAMREIERARDRFLYEKEAEFVAWKREDFTSTGQISARVENAIQCYFGHTIDPDLIYATHRAKLIARSISS